MLWSLVACRRHDQAFGRFPQQEEHTWTAQCHFLDFCPWNDLLEHNSATKHCVKCQVHLCLWFASYFHFWLVTWISNKEKTTYFLPRKVQSAEPWHPYYEKCLSTFHLLLLHIFDFTWTYIQFGRQCFLLHCCKWYVATWEHWCQKAFSRVSDEPGIETEDKMHLMRMFQFLTARQNLVIRINISLTFFWLSNAQNLVFRINILLTLSLVLKSLCSFLHLGQMILLPLLPWTFPLVTAQVHNGVHEDVGGGTSSKQQWRRQRIYTECRQWSLSS